MTGKDFLPQADLNFVPEADLEDRRVYKLHSRNLRYGVWREDTGIFYGVRHKFGSRYIDGEYLWRDEGGTANPIGPMDFVVPREIALQEILELECRYCHKEVVQVYKEDADWLERGINKGMKRVGDKHVEDADADACEFDGQHVAQWRSNTPLFEYMQRIEDMFEHDND